MTDKEAYKIYKEIERHIAENQEDRGCLDVLKDTEILVDWHDSVIPAFTNIFDRRLVALFGSGTNTVSDVKCTILHKGVYVNIWEHYGIASVGCPFGFYNDNNEFVICYASNMKNPDEPEYVIQDTISEEDDRKKLIKHMLLTIWEIIHPFKGVMDLDSPVRFYESDSTDSPYCEIIAVEIDEVNWDKPQPTLCGYDANGKEYVLENMEGYEPLKNFDSITAVYKKAFEVWRDNIATLLLESDTLKQQEQFGN